MSLAPPSLRISELLHEVQGHLARAADLVEAKEVCDQAQALRGYLTQEGECLELRNAAIEVKIRAERRVGELLAGLPMLGDLGGDNPSDRKVPCAFLEAIGIHARRSARWQESASVPEEVFDTYVLEANARGELLTSASVRQLAPPADDGPPRPPTIDELISRLVLAVAAGAERGSRARRDRFVANLREITSQVEARVAIKG